MTPRTVLVVSPHPDDELIPAGGTLLTLRDAGWQILNLACGLGRPDQHERRRAELTQACEVAGFELDCVEPPLSMSRGDDLDAARRRLVPSIEARLDALEPDLVVAPGPTEHHHGHELVARAVIDAVASTARPLTLWWWELWGQLGHATLLVDVEELLDRVVAALRCHVAELERSDYARLVGARAEVAGILGPERVFGYGTGAGAGRAAEVLCEAHFTPQRWSFGRPRRLDRSAPALGPFDGGDASDFVAVGLS